MITFEWLRRFRVCRSKAAIQNVSSSRVKPVRRRTETARQGEVLETRTLLTMPTFDALTDLAIPSGQTY